MTQESPVLLCHDCRTPMKEAAGSVAGEQYCRECLPDAVVRMYDHD